MHWQEKFEAYFGVKLTVLKKEMWVSNPVLDASRVSYRWVSSTSVSQELWLDVPGQWVSKLSHHALGKWGLKSNATEWAGQKAFPLEVGVVGHALATLAHGSAWLYESVATPSARSFRMSLLLEAGDNAQSPFWIHVWMNQEAVLHAFAQTRDLCVVLGSFDLPEREPEVMEVGDRVIIDKRHQDNYPVVMRNQMKAEQAYMLVQPIGEFDPKGLLQLVHGETEEKALIAKGILNEWKQFLVLEVTSK